MSAAEYYLSKSWGQMVKSASDAEDSPHLCGRLVVSQSGWLLLSVPNAIVHGLFDSLDVAGIELPLHKGKLNAHISVMTKAEVEALGGPDAITERGHMYHFNLGPLQEVEPKTWEEVSRVWFVKCKSPELERLRKSYGLSGTPRDGKHDYHITIAIRKKKVLVNSDVSKAAGADALAAAISRESCPSCSARLERGDDGNCNRCGKPWPEKSAGVEELMEKLSQECPPCPSCGSILTAHSRARGANAQCQDCGHFYVDPEYGRNSEAKKLAALCG